MGSPLVAHTHRIQRAMNFLSDAPLPGGPARKAADAIEAQEAADAALRRSQVRRRLLLDRSRWAAPTHTTSREP